HLKLIDVRMEQDGDTIRITARRDVPQAAAKDAATIKKQFGPRSADAVVRVPAKAALELKSAYGDIRLKGIGGPVEADSTSGSIHVKAATGAIKAKSHYGDVTVEQAPAGATLDTNSGHVRLKGGRGPVQLSSGYGDVDADVAGAVVLAKSKSGHVRVVGRL